MDFKVRGEDLLGDEYVIASDVEVPPGHILLSPHNDRLYGLLGEEKREVGLRRVKEHLITFH